MEDRSVVEKPWWTKLLLSFSSFIGRKSKRKLEKIRKLACIYMFVCLFAGLQGPPGLPGLPVSNNPLNVLCTTFEPTNM